MSNAKKTLILAIVLANIIAGYAAWTIAERVTTVEEKARSHSVMIEIGSTHWLDLVKRANVIEDRQNTLRNSLALTYVEEKVVPATYKATNQLLHFHTPKKKSQTKVVGPQRQTKVPVNVT